MACWSAIAARRCTRTGMSSPGRRARVRHAHFAGVRLEEWEKGVIKPHEHTLSGPKEDRLELLRATRTQVSPVYCLYRGDAGAPARCRRCAAGCSYDVEAGGQRHTLSAIIDDDAIWSISSLAEMPASTSPTATTATRRR